jgi:hypothetical protein
LKRSKAAPISTLKASVDLMRIPTRKLNFTSSDV